MSEVEVKTDKGILKVLAERVGDSLWFHYNGEVYSYRPEKKGRSRRSAADSDTGDLAAPMPGKITQIRVKVGEAVSYHQVLIVMEAMKMEYTLKCNRAGTVANIECKVGDQVVVGQLLLKVEAPKNNG